MIIRVVGPCGTKRCEVEAGQSTADLIPLYFSQILPHGSQSVIIFVDAAMSTPLPSKSFQELGLKHGAMVYARHVKCQEEVQEQKKKWWWADIPKELTQKELMESINLELCAALQQLVDVVQAEHTLTVPNVAQSSVSASHVTEEARGRGSFSPPSKASVAVDPRNRNAHYLRTLGHDDALRQFVIVWIATVLMSARVDFPMGSIADAIHCSKNNSVCRVGWAAEGACIALVTALKAAQRVSFVTDDRRKSITEAFGNVMAHYSFSKVMKGISVSAKVKMRRIKRRAVLQRHAANAAFMNRINEELCNVNQELCAALQQLVDVIQAEHMRTLGHDDALRQFVIVWIATVLMSARVDFPMGNIADAIHCSKNNSVCRVGWAAEGACIALVTALKAAQRVSFVTDDRRKSITEAFGNVMAHYSFSKSFDLKSHPISIEHCFTILMKKLFVKKERRDIVIPTEESLHFRPRFSDAIDGFYRWHPYHDGFDDRTFFTSSASHEFEFITILNLEERISRTLWHLALHSLNTDRLRVFSRDLVTLFKFAVTDFAKSVLSQVIHGHQKVTRQVTQRTGGHPRYGWRESKGGVNEWINEWITSKFYRSAFHMKFSAALVAEGAFPALIEAFDSAETNETRASIALAMAFLASSAEICQEMDSGVASAAAKARDSLRKHLNKMHIYSELKHLRWNIHALGCSDFLSRPHRDEVIVPYLDLDRDRFSSNLTHCRDREMMADALEALCENGSSSTVPIHGVGVTVERISMDDIFDDRCAYHGNHVLSDTRSHYEGRWARSETGQQPDPSRFEYNPHFVLQRIQGRMHGKGVLVYGNGDSYAGEWIQGRKSGNGVYKWSHGGFFGGEWFEGKPTVPLSKSHLKKVRFIQHANASLAPVGRNASQQSTSNTFHPAPSYSLNLERALSARSYFSCLFADRQSELCRTRCKEVFFIAERLTLQSTFCNHLHKWKVSTNQPEHFLRMSCASIAQRVFCGQHKRVLWQSRFQWFLQCFDTPKSTHGNDTS